MNTRRLRLLVTKLRNIPAEQFDYDKFVDTDTWKGKPDLSCGTQACALGWATVIPEIRKAGLRLEVGEFGIGKVVLKSGKARYINFDAAARVFGLSHKSADYLFGGNVTRNGDATKKPMTAKQVARRIERFIETELKKPVKQRSKYTQYDPVYL